MKKETVNTFDKGLVKDLHPLTTPNNVLTDALNATLITYNGNENVLLNDMGNAEIGTAKLPSGYVPVAMKEYGGIVYVAAWNPESEKGQIGCFPSPLQNFEEEEWSVNSGNAYSLAEVGINKNDFYDVNAIVNETLKIVLFKDINGNSKVFHPGDKYCITISEGSKLNTLYGYVDNNLIKLQLGVIKSDGAIEIIADATNDRFISPDSHRYRIFNGSSSGSLILIVTIITFDSFNLIREYSKNGDYIEVKFTGEATLDGQIYKSETSNKLKLYSASLGDLSSMTISSLNGQSQPYSIYPCLPYGYVKRMEQSGSIDFNKVKKDKGDFNEWRFYVTDEYVKIGWSYDYYNLDKDKDIDHIELDLYDFTEITNENIPNPKCTIELYKESYSGSFEDYIRFADILGFEYNKIYIVKISTIYKLNSSSDIIAWKMLYCNQLYNNSYNNLESRGGVKTFTRKNVPITIKCSKELTYTLQVPKINISKSINNTSTLILTNGSVNNVDANRFIIDNPNEGDVYEYTTQSSVTTNVNLHVKLDYVGLDKVIGNPESNYLNNVTRSLTYTNLEINKDESWNSNNLYQEFSTVNNNTQFSFQSKVDNDNETDLTFEVNDTSYIQGTSGAIRKEPYTTYGLFPIFDTKSNAQSQEKVFSGYNEKNARLICGNKLDFFLATMRGYTNELIDSGSPLPGGTDDAGIDTAVRQMNTNYTSTVNMFGGSSSDAKIMWRKPNNLTLNRNSGVGIVKDNDNDSIDDDNYLIAIWKFDDGYSRLVNMFSLRRYKEGNNIGSALSYPRLDVMIKCFLSQIFIPLKVTKSHSYITTNPDCYRYLNGKTSIALKLVNSVSDLDIMTSNGTTLLLDLFLLWVSKTNNNNGIPKLTSDDNLLPIVSVSAEEQQISISKELDTDFAIDLLTKYYMGVANTSNSIDTTIDPQSLYYYDINNNSLTYTIRQDGAFDWSRDANETDLVKYGQSNEPLLLKDWNNNIWKFMYSLYDMFTTTAILDGWSEILEDNELLAKKDLSEGLYYGYRPGTWYDGSNEDAPDLWYRTMLSNKSLFLQIDDTNYYSVWP